jgi:hypothetical protein
MLFCCFIFFIFSWEPEISALLANISKGFDRVHYKLYICSFGGYETHDT